MSAASVRFLGGPFDGLESHITKCRHGAMPDVNLCMRVVEPSSDPVLPDWDCWPDMIRYMTTPEVEAAWWPGGPGRAYDVARYGWNDDVQMYVYAETVRRELHPEHDREDEL